MKKPVKSFALFLLTLFVFFLFWQQWSCGSAKIPIIQPTDTLVSNAENNGWLLEITFIKGAEHNHPLMAFWITDTANSYIETLYIAESIAKGVFKYANKDSGIWQTGPVRRPAALPAWSHNRGIKEKDGLYIPTQNTPITDAVTGATPKNNFILYSKTKAKYLKPFFVYFEVNQTWDWNEFWTNNKYPDDEEYKTSCQPALVYRVLIDGLNLKPAYTFELLGHSHYNGANGEITTDVSTITTAKNISKNISLKVMN